MKRFLFILCLFLFLGCDTTETKVSDLIDFIPRKAAVIIKTNDLDKFISQIKNNALLANYNTTTYGQKLTKFEQLLSNFKSSQESLITFTKIGKDDLDISFITKKSTSLSFSDSTKFALKRLNTTTPPITQISTETTSFFTVTIADVFIASSSQLLLENIIREQQNAYRKESLFTKGYNSMSDKAVASILIKGKEAGILWKDILPKATNNSFQEAFSWLQADIDLTQEDLKLNGVVLVKDSTNQYLELFKNLQPQQNSIAQITPSSAIGAVSFTYDNWKQYQNNLAEYNGLDPSKFELPQAELLSSFNEIGLISVQEGNAVVGTTFDVEQTDLALSSEQKTSSTFRQVSIFKLEGDDFKNAFTKAFSNLMQLPKVTYYCKLETFYLFAPTQNVLENIIANYQNKATLSSSKSYQNTASQLSRASSLLLVSNTNKIPYTSLVSEKEAKKLASISLERYPFAAVQLIQDNGFMHLHGIINKNESPLKDGAIVQIASTKLDEAIMMAPQLVKNHRTKGSDIVLQDQVNNLYLLSNSGKILWKKPLDSPIVGEIQQVDLYRNGRLQLAFATERQFHILDRNGKEVAPFPIKFTEEITQPLAIFDYEKNRNYRFVITQTDKVTMYDKAAKKVTGFTFSKASDEIILPPQHLRIGNKDYITIAENSGKLNILSRTGKSRIEVTEKINFSGSKFYKEDAHFMTYDVNGEKITINSSGKVTQIATEYGSGSKVVSEHNLTTCIRDNILYINTKKLDLPFGTYTEPYIITIKGKTYISSTDTEANQTYVFDQKGALLENFPVYGTSSSVIDNLERNKSLGLVTQGDSRTVLLYRIN